MAGHLEGENMSVVVVHGVLQCVSGKSVGEHVAVVVATLCTSQFARVVKGVDLRSTAGNCAWARTPQLTFPVPKPEEAR